MANARSLYTIGGKQYQLQDDDVLLANALEVFATVPGTLNLFSTAGTYAVNLLTGTTGNVTIAAASTGTVAIGAVADVVTIGAAATTMTLGDSGTNVGIPGNLTVDGTETVTGLTTFETDVVFGDNAGAPTVVTYNVDSTTVFESGAVIGDATRTSMVFDTTAAAQSITGNGTAALTLANTGAAGLLVLNSAATTSNAIDINSTGIGGAIDIDSAGAVTVNAGAASNFTSTSTMTVEGVGLTLEGGTAGFDLLGDTTSTIVSSGGAITMTAGASSVWSTSAGTLTVSGVAGATYRAGNDTNVSLLTTGTGLATVSSGSGGIDITSSGAGAIDVTTGATGNVNITTGAGGGFSLDTSAGAGTIGIVSAAGAINIDSSAAAVTIQGGASSSVTTSAGGLTLQGATTVDIDALGGRFEITGTTASTVSVNGAALTLATTGTNNVNVTPGSGVLAVTTDHTTTALALTVDNSGTPSSADFMVGSGSPDTLVTGTTGDIYLDVSSGAPWYCTGTTNWTQVGSATGYSSLQQAYDTGANIITASTTDIDFTLTSGGFAVSTSASGNVVIDNGTNNYLRTDHSNSQLELGAGGATVTVGFLGYVDTGITFEGAQTLATSSGVLTVTGASGITASATTGNIGIDAVAGTLTLDGATSLTAQSAGTATFQSTAGAVQVQATAGQALLSGSSTTTVRSTSGNVAITSNASTDLDAVGSVGINSSGGVITIGDDSVNQDMYIGTGGTRTINVGNANSTTTLDLNAGTGGVTVDTTGSIALTSTDVAGSVSLASAGFINLQTTAGTDNIRLNPLGGFVNIETNGLYRAIRMRTDQLGTTSDASIYLHDATPQGTVTGTTGSLCMRTDVGSLYYCTGGTNWTLVGSATGTDLQSAYDNFTGAATVTLDATGDLTWVVPAAATFYDVVWTDANADNFLVVDASAHQLVLGSNGGTNDKDVNFAGQVASNIAFDGTAGRTLTNAGTMIVSTTGANLLSLTGGGGITSTSTGGTYAVTATGQAVTIDGAGISIDGTAASNFSTSSGALTLTSAAAATWSTAAGALSVTGTGGLNLTGTNNLVAINSGTAATTVVSGGTSSWTNTSGSLTLSTVTSGDVALAAASNSDVTIDTLGTGDITLTSVQDITFDARGATTPMTFNEAGETDLQAGGAFGTAGSVTSVVAALNALDSALTTNDVVMTEVIAGEDLAIGEVVGIEDNAGTPTLYKTDADAAGTRSIPIGVVKTAATTGNYPAVYLAGRVAVYVGAGSGLTVAANVGSEVYTTVSDLTRGYLSTTAPTTGTLTRVGWLAKAGTATATDGFIVMGIGNSIEL